MRLTHTKNGSTGELHTKSVNSMNKLDRFIHKNNSKIKLNSLDLINQTNNSIGTPVTIASVYDPTDPKKIIRNNLIVLIDSGASHSMAKASLVMTYKNCFLSEAKPRIKLPSVRSKVNLP